MAVAVRAIVPDSAVRLLNPGGRCAKGEGWYGPGGSVQFCPACGGVSVTSYR